MFPIIRQVAAFLGIDFVSVEEFYQHDARKSRFDSLI